MAKILIIEDDQSLLNNLKLALDKYQIITAQTASEGINKNQKEKPDLILLDLLLPDKNGIEVIQQIKNEQETKKTPIIVLTNLNDAETISKIMQAGGTEYFIKADWSLEDLVKKIEKYL